MGKVCYIQFDSLLCRKFPMKHTADIQMSIFRDFGNCCFLLHFSAAKILFLQWQSIIHTLSFVFLKQHSLQ